MSPLKLFTQLNHYRFGKWLFTRIVCFNVPFFSSIRPLIIELNVGQCKVQMSQHRSVQNHIGTIHAIAVCNLCELAMGMVAEVTIPQDLSWIPKEMKIRYLKKATGTLLAVCEISPDLFKEGELIVPVDVINDLNELVVKADTILRIKKKQKFS